MQLENVYAQKICEPSWESFSAPLLNYRVHPPENLPAGAHADIWPCVFFFPPVLNTAADCMYLYMYMYMHMYVHVHAHVCTLVHVPLFGTVLYNPTKLFCGAVLTLWKK